MRFSWYFSCHLVTVLSNAITVDLYYSCYSNSRTYRMGYLKEVLLVLGTRQNVRIHLVPCSAMTCQYSMNRTDLSQSSDLGSCSDTVRDILLENYDPVYFSSDRICIGMIIAQMIMLSQDEPNTTSC